MYLIHRYDVTLNITIGSHCPVTEPLDNDVVSKDNLRLAYDLRNRKLSSGVSDDGCRVSLELS